MPTTPAGGGTVAPINYQSGAGAIIDLGKYLVGSKTSETTKTAGQTDELSKILSTLNPQALEALVANLFSQGAAQVPGLTAQFAGATGTRTTGNSMLGQSLAMLNQTLAQSIAQAALQQQQIAVQAAGKIADVNKTQSASRTTGPGSMSKGLARAVTPTLVGFGLNRVGKAMDANKAAAGAEDISGPVEVNPTFQTFPSGIVGEGGPQVGDLGAFNEGTFEASPLLSESGGVLEYAPDFLNAASDSAAVAEAFDVADADIAEAFDGFSDFADWGYFKDGGRVKPKSLNYADGGRVAGVERPQIIRNRPNMGVRPPILTTRTAAAPVTRRKSASGAPQDEAIDTGAVGNPAGIGISGVGSPASNAVVASMMNPLSILGIMSSILGPTPVESILAKALTKTVLNELFNPEETVEAINMPPMPPAIAVDAMGNPVTTAMPPAIFDPTLGIESTEAGIESMAAAVEGVASEGDTGGTADGSAGTAGGGVSGDSGGDASGVGDGGFRDGGRVSGGSAASKSSKKPSPYSNPPGGVRGNRIEGPGTSTSDSVNINASVDEYILPADTVYAIGKKTLDELVASTHMPAGRGTHG